MSSKLESCETPELRSQSNLSRRTLLQTGSAFVIASCMPQAAKLIDNPTGPAFLSEPHKLTGNPFGGLDLASDWEGLNQGYWKADANGLRRRIRSYGDRARDTGFPFHYESQSNPDGAMTIDYDPSLPLGIMWNRHWRFETNYGISFTSTVKALTSKIKTDDDPSWAMYQPGYGLFGVAFGGKSQFESFFPSKGASPMFVVKENGDYGFYKHSSTQLNAVSKNSVGKLKSLKIADKLTVSLSIQGNKVTSKLSVNNQSAPDILIDLEANEIAGYFGIVARGLLDTTFEDLKLEHQENSPLSAPLNDCHVCYALGDTLEETDKGWKVRFIAIFRTNGERVEIRVSNQENPNGGWGVVPIAGEAEIISNDFRINTAIIDVILPQNPADTTLYYVVAKDGMDVTSDPRIGTDSVGPGTGLVGDTPGNGQYVGRLPQLKAPYRLAGLSCHAINTASYTELTDEFHGHCGGRIVGQGEIKAEKCGIDKPLFVHDQPCLGSFQHIEDFNYQIMLWEDDIWYMELLLYPPSTQDAYKVITTTIAGPTTRWQMMRHWNVLNPGDHDHGMDDIKGPEQILIRTRDGLGQDPNYMVRNFQIVSHLMTGKEHPSGTDNPKRWRKWKMPNRDFTLLVADSRLWRTSQDPAIWDDEGWGADKELYSRTDPTRTLLGEEQFGWLSQELKTDSSPLICITGINVLHTIWGGHGGNHWLNEIIDRDRVSADYAGWVKVGADRVLDLMSARSGVVSVYGDVHAGTIVRNKNLNLFECSFGPIGRWGGRSLIDGFGRHMKDADGRDVEVISLYHHEYEDADLTPATSKNYWNVLEAIFDPLKDDAEIRLRIRNITDSPEMPVRGGGDVIASASSTGRPPITTLPPKLRTLPNSDVVILTINGAPIVGTRTNTHGEVKLSGFSSVAPSDDVIVIANNGDKSESQIVSVLPV